jgi:hypothetical protein
MCELFTNSSLFDRWVIPHQVLPFSLVAIGIPPHIAMLLLYLFETFETIAITCLKITDYPETITDSVVSDPIMGFIGILVAFVICRRSPDGGFPIINVEDSPHRIFPALLLILSPGFLFSEHSYDSGAAYAYPFVAGFALLAVIVVVERPNWKRPNIMALGVDLFYSFVYFGALTLNVLMSDTTNSFLLALGIGFGFVLSYAAVFFFIRRSGGARDY